MARKSASKPTKPPKRASKSTVPTPETLAALPAEVLIRLILDEVAQNLAFRKRVSAAIAGLRGPDAVAAIVDRRLSALEKARGYIDWDKSRTFSADLAATLAVILSELKPLDPDMALERLRRFLDGAEGVLGRADDSSGRIHGVYEHAASAAADIAGALPPGEAGAFAQSLAPLLDRDGFGLIEGVMERLLPTLTPEALDALDARFARALDDLPKPPLMQRGSTFFMPNADTELRLRRRAFGRLRKAIADARGDVDAFLALEQAESPHRPDAIAIAERLLAAGRPGEALDWIRKENARRPLFTRFRLLGGEPEIGAFDQDRHDVEVRILEALGRRDEAQALRWVRFETVLDPKALRDHLAQLPDFEDEGVLERAFALAEAFANPLASLDFLVRWPRLDRAARLVIAHRDAWDGRDWEWLAPAAKALSEDHPLAASILYRALIDDILERARVQAYGHGARYLTSLDTLSERLAPGSLEPDPAGYRAALRKAHGRKSGFWSLVRA